MIRHAAPMGRALYLVAYDVSCSTRLRQTLHAVKAHRASGQKSVAECFLHSAERDRLCATLAHILESGEDRLHVFRLDPRQETRLFGVASQYRGRSFIID